MLGATVEDLVCRATDLVPKPPTMTWLEAAGPGDLLLRAGGTDNGAPGLRDTALGYPPGYYTAFVLDPDGNNTEAVCRGRVPSAADGGSGGLHQAPTSCFANAAM
jgi:hypothetical protein